jgi:glutamate--cysteine ligase
MDFINSMQDLINYFQEGCKKEDQLSIGVEHEKFLFDGHSNQRVNFETITKVFNFLEKFGWKPIKEKNNVIALKREGQNITLEPGNQVELSGAKLKSIHLVCNESYKFLDELKEACKKINLKMMSVSFDPFTKLQSVPKTPKQRYEIMTNEMPKKGELSLHMMYQTCGTQINLDYTSEKDFVKKFKLSSFLVPISIAIFANSSIVENKNSGYLSYRSKVWQHTARAGLPKYFLEDMNFEKYADMVMKMPLLFVLKDSNYLNAAGKTFKDFVAGNLSIVNNAKSPNRDFKTHLATIFTEVRLKQYIEIRSLDTCEWDCHCGGPAFYVGLLYASLDEAHDIISKWNVSEVLNAYIEAPKKGLNTLIGSKTILEWGKIFLSLSRKGLEKRSIKNDAGKDESIFLRNIESILTNEKTKAEITIEKFKKDKNLDFLYEKKE